MSNEKPRLRRYLIYLNFVEPRLRWSCAALRYNGVAGKAATKDWPFKYWRPLEEAASGDGFKVGDWVMMTEGHEGTKFIGSDKLLRVTEVHATYLKTNGPEELLKGYSVQRSLAEKVEVRRSLVKAARATVPYGTIFTIVEKKLHDDGKHSFLIIDERGDSWEDWGQDLTWSEPA